MKKIYNSFCAGDMSLIYILDESTGLIGFTILPEKRKNQFVLEGDWKVESLIQAKCMGDNYPVGFSGGHSMRNSETSMSLKFQSQEFQEDEDGKCRIRTIVKNSRIRGEHIVAFHRKSKCITVHTEVKNIGEKTENLEMLSSFSMCSLFGTKKESRTEDFILHRLRSKWSEEGRLQSENFLGLQLEPSWQKYGIQSIRYGQVGSMPVRRYFPWAVIEDKKNEWMLGVLMDAPASWQIEVFSEDDRPAISGGIADREFGHWTKQLMPGSTFETPKVQISVCEGDLDDICYRLTEEQRESLQRRPAIEKNLPIVFNEFCANWGKPTENKIAEQVKALAGKGITYFVIDAGWYSDSEKGWESNMGDWIPNKNAFPNGLKKASEIIRKCGMIPGLWFEVETCGKDAGIYGDLNKLLTRDGYPLSTGKRRFLDMRKKKVQDYLEEKVIRCLMDNNFGYLKVDYNDTIGIGCDGAESLGAGLLDVISESQKFYKKIRIQIPDLVMENCSSGGHRLEPSMMRLFSMASFSDAHECVSEPIIAANVLRTILPAQSLIWAVMRPEMDRKRLRYLLTTTFLGRMCLSGDVEKLRQWQWELISEAIAFYKMCTDTIGNAKVFRKGPKVQSYAKPEGYQIIGLSGENGILLVIHTFSYEGSIEEKIDKMEKYRLSGRFGDENVKIALKEKNILEISRMNSFDGIVLRFEKKLEN